MEQTRAELLLQSRTPLLTSFNSIVSVIAERAREDYSEATGPGRAAEKLEMLLRIMAKLSPFLIIFKSSSNFWLGCVLRWRVVLPCSRGLQNRKKGFL